MPRYKISLYGDEIVIRESSIPVIGKIFNVLYEKPQIAGILVILSYIAIMFMQYKLMLPLSVTLLFIGAIIGILYYMATLDEYTTIIVMLVFFLGYVMFSINPKVDQYATLILYNTNMFANNMYQEIPYAIYTTSGGTIGVGTLFSDYWALAMLFLVDAFIAIVAFRVPEYRYAAQLAITLFTLGYPVGWFLYVMVTGNLPTWAQPVLQLLVDYGAEVGRLWAAFAVLFVLVSLQAPIFIFIQLVTSSWWASQLIPVRSP